MKRKITVQISEGLGNQLFMFANAYAISRKYNYDLLIDRKTGYLKKKNLLRPHQHFLLDKFNLSNIKISNNILSINYFSIILKKILILFDKFKKKKIFFTEKVVKKNNKKIINKLENFNPSNFGKNIYIQGNFECELYFKDYKNQIKKLFTPKVELNNILNQQIEKLTCSDSVSIHLRRNRFSDQKNISKNIDIQKSNAFTLDIIEYVNRAITYIEDNVKNPKYFIWTNDIKNIDFFTSKLNIKNFELIYNSNALTDFHLFSYSKNFIVGPSSFHWWGAWLNENNGKICLRPKNLNPSNNVNFWPKDWISI